MRTNSLILALSASFVSATNLWIADYGGLITTAALSEKDGAYTLIKTGETDKCGPNPSWLTVDTNRGLMFCLNEGLATVNGSVASFTIGADATLNFVRNDTTINGPVHGLIYGNPAGQRGLVATHYVGSAVTTYKLLGGGALERNQDFTFTGNGPEEQQNAPHPHEAILDPTGKYILVPDLGLDVVHVYAWDRETLALTELESLKVTPGTGPRHAVFWTPSGTACDTCTTYMFLVGELSADLTGFEVKYEEGGKGLTFNNVSHALTQPNLPSNAPAEVEITPDGRFILVSNRDVPPTDSPTPLIDSKNSSLASFFLHEGGQLGPLQLTTSDLIGHGYPRHFSLNKYGNLVAVGLQYTNQAIILSRNTSSGEINPEPVAKLGVTGNVTNVVWDE